MLPVVADERRADVIAGPAKLTTPRPAPIPKTSMAAARVPITKGRINVIVHRTINAVVPNRCGYLPERRSNKYTLNLSHSAGFEIGSGFRS
jgi:hypothetical protein